jgi:hypothetical protein
MFVQKNIGDNYMCGGSKPKDPGPSKQEIALAAVSQDDYNRWVQRGMPLERQAVARARDPNVLRAQQSILGGRSSADIAQQEVGAQYAARQAALRSGAGLRSNSNMIPMTQTSAVANVSQAKAATRAAVDARQIQDRAKVTALQSGAGLAQNQYSGLMAAARRGNSRNLTDISNEAMRQQARMRAFGDVAGAALTIGAQKYFSGKQNAEMAEQDYMTGLQQEYNQYGKIPSNPGPYDMSYSGGLYG